MRQGRGWRDGVLAACAALLFLACPAPCLATTAAEPTIVSLDGKVPAVDAPAAVAWTGPAELASVEAFAAGRLPARPAVHGASLLLRGGMAVWLKLRLQPVADGASWMLEVPLAVIDRVTVYQQDPRGGWTHRTAGDTVRRSHWPQNGRYPFFTLQLRPGAVNDVYVEVRHATPLAVPLRLVTLGEHETRSQLEYLGLGTLLGALGLLVLANIVRAWMLRDGAHAGYALYTLIATLALAAFTGVAGHLFWGEAQPWADAAPGCLALLGASVYLLLVGKLSGVATRPGRLGRSLQLVGASGFLLAPGEAQRRDAVDRLLEVLEARHAEFGSSQNGWKKKEAKPSRTAFAYCALVMMSSAV
jgi:hypothetical protein